MEDMRKSVHLKTRLSNAYSKLVESHYTNPLGLVKKARHLAKFPYTQDSACNELCIKIRYYWCRWYPRDTVDGGRLEASVRAAVILGSIYAEEDPPTPT
jgi:hypothetical protein